MRICIGNLSYDTTADDVRQAFETFGRVEAVTVIKSKPRGHSKAFGFVRMSSKSEAVAAIYEMDGTVLKGNRIRVNLARSKADGSHRVPGVSRQEGML